MRSFIALAVVAVAGCGDNLGDSLENPALGEPTDLAALDDSEVGRLVPDVCAAQSWPDALTDAKNIQLRVVETAGGANVLGVSRFGGPLRGFLVDERGEIRGDKNGTVIRDGVYTAMSANVQDGRLVVGLVDGDAIRINLLRADLGDYHELTKLRGQLLGDTVMMPARDHLATVTGGDNGLVLSSFDAAWAPLGSEVIARAIPTSMASATYGRDAMVAWSTTSECHLQRVAAGVSSMRKWPCPGLRIATDFDGRGGAMVYEHKGVQLADIRTSYNNELGDVRQLDADGHAPRIVFDGDHYWVSYLSAEGEVVVGYLDEDRQLVSIALRDVRPAFGAYDLALVNGAVEMYALDEDTGLTARRLCLPAE